MIFEQEKHKSWIIYAQLANYSCHKYHLYWFRQKMPFFTKMWFIQNYILQHNLSYSEARVLKFGKCMHKKVQKIHRNEFYKISLTCFFDPRPPYRLKWNPDIKIFAKLPVNHQNSALTRYLGISGTEKD